MNCVWYIGGHHIVPPTYAPLAIQPQQAFERLTIGYYMVIVEPVTFSRNMYGKS